MRLLTAVALLGFILASFASPRPEAPTDIDNKSNGLVDNATHQADQNKFDETEEIADGLGPLYIKRMTALTFCFLELTHSLFIPGKGEEWS
jgi:hypothetical protein